MIYLDNNATTACDPLVIASMLPYFSSKYGNAGSTQHPFGWTADEAIKQSRLTIANALNCLEQEIVFTSGATESCNLAIKGVYDVYQTKGKHIITVQTEHNAVLDVCQYLEIQGASVSYLEVSENGLIDLQVLEKTIQTDTILVAIMFANNETGVLQNIEQIGAICKAKKVLFFTDATQAFAKLPIDVLALNIDLLAFSAHKIYGPKGIGGLYIRRKDPRVHIMPQIHGGGQERARRSGTLNVPGIVGMAKALQIYQATGAAEQQTVQLIRDTFEERMMALFPDIIINGISAPRMYNVSNMAIQGIQASKLIALTNSALAFSLGSACISNNNKPSHVLKAMKLPDTRLNGSIRVSFGRNNHLNELPIIINKFDRAIRTLIK